MHPEEARLEEVAQGARYLRCQSRGRKDAVLLRLADLLESEHDALLLANREDLGALDSSATEAFRDRLTLTEGRLREMADSLRQVARLPDPVGEVVEETTLPNGLQVKKRRGPIGVIFMVFESRPNVATEAFSLGFKAGNAMILRGGKESSRTTAVLYGLIWRSLDECGLRMECFRGISDPDRAIVSSLLKRDDKIDLVIPRGGPGLIDFVVGNTRIPVIKHDRGLCHLFVDGEADLAMAIDILENGKTQRPSACNALETVLVHRAVADAFLPRAHERLTRHGVRWFCDESSLMLLRGRPLVEAAGPDSFDTEYLDQALSCAVVDSLAEALTHIEAHGSKHSEAIVTRNEVTAREFQDRLDSAAVYWNASPRFTDGYSLGLGAEIGISTQKLHARGPVGLRELTSVRWVVDGTGQVRP